jgi:hypothetical protein
MNTYINPDANLIPAHPANKPFTNIGEIGMIFRKPAYYPIGGDSNGVIGYNGMNNTEPDVRLNLADSNFQQIFKYLTVWPPSVYVSDPNETRVKGRININTAPWFVLAQLPWVSQRENNYDSNSLAQAIVAYRDGFRLTSIGGPDYSSRGAPGFGSIGQLCNVVNPGGDPNFGIDYYASLDSTPDFEERDLIFARISNLVTVRSDVFTAYILVRIGTDGPQKRVIAIFDRSTVPIIPIKITIQPVAEPR